MFRSFWRTVRRHPSFVATVVGLLGLGIGAGTVVFTTVDALVFDPFPFPRPERLLVVGTEMPQTGLPLGFFERLSGPELVALEERSTTLSSLLPFDLNSVRLRGPEFPLRLFAAFCWADPFTTLRVTPLLGRGFAPEELRAGAPVLVISHQLWAGALGGDPKILGQPLELDGIPHTVVGVMPPRTSLYGIEAWLPNTEVAATLPRGQRQFNLLARMAEGANLVTVNAELQGLADALANEFGRSHPEYDQWRLEAVSWNEWSAFTYRQEALLSFGAVLFVLLLVCANLANLLLARALGRRQETAVRLALGANQRQVLTQTLKECAGYALAGGALALLTAQIGTRLVASWLPAAVQPSGKPIALDLRAFTFASVATLLTALLIGILPALRLTRTSLDNALRQTPGRTSTNSRGRTLESLLVTTQVALAVILLSGAGLLLQNLVRNLEIDLGFEAESLLSMRLTLPRTEYERAEVPPFFDRLVEEVEALPGVERASLATQVAPSTFFGGTLYLPEATADEAGRPRILHTAVGNNYFRAMGMPLIRGRSFDLRDDAASPPTLVINELAAQRFFPGQDPIGLHARVAGSTWDTTEAEIVGIVATVKNLGPAQAAAPEIFSHHRQAQGRYNQMFLIVRAIAAPYSLLPAIRRTVRGLDPNQPVYAIGTAQEAIANDLAPTTVATTVLGGFSSLAFLLAALGIYGTVACSVSRRRQEMGLRMALGATRREITDLVVRQALSPVVVGLLCGAFGSWMLARLFAGTFEPAAEFGWKNLAASTVALLTATLLASIGPAQQAGRVSPTESLREL